MSRAAQALVSLGMDWDSEGVLQEMLDKHPSAKPPRTLEEALESAPITVNSEVVGEAVKSFWPDSAPGPSVRHGEHIKEEGIRGDGRGVAVLGALMGLINTHAAGNLPAAAAPFFSGANLFTTKKKTGWGLRPMAVGRVL